MSADINYNERRGTYSFVSRKEIPWHGLGKIVDKPMTSEEAIKYANADYKVLLSPVYAKLGHASIDFARLEDNIIKTNYTTYNRTKQVPNAFATYREDTNDVFGIVGNRYEVVQNTEAFNFIDEIVKTGEAVIETAGVLGNGERIFVTAKLPNYIKIAGDEVEGYLFITNSHDGSQAITAAITKIRIVCNNTLTAALHSCTNKINLRHTKNVHDRLGEGLRLMKMTNDFDREFAEVMNQLNKPIEQLNKYEKYVENHIAYLILSKDELHQYIERDHELNNIDDLSVRKKNMINNMMNTVFLGVGQDRHVGTPLHLFNGITCFYSNVKPYKDDQSRLDGLLQGTENSIIQKSFNKLIL